MCSRRAGGHWTIVRLGLMPVTLRKKDMHYNKRSIARILIRTTGVGVVALGFSFLGDPNPARADKCVTGGYYELKLRNVDRLSGSGDEAAESAYWNSYALFGGSFTFLDDSGKHFERDAFTAERQKD